MIVPLHGWIVIDKPVGPGSTEMVTAVKRALRAGGYPRLKVGHGGTLDPLASGVLPVALGEATKLAGRMLGATKTYEFTIALGEETDSLDREGVVVETSPIRPDRAQWARVLPRFTGPIEQTPPVYSALKIEGRRACDRVRAGESVTIAPRAITIHALHLIDATSAWARFRATVSKGTYIRSLARDLAQAAGTVGHVSALRRTRAGPFGIEQAISLDFLGEMGQARRLDEICLPMEAGLDDIPALTLTPDQAGLLRKGRILIGMTAPDGTALDGCHFARLGTLPVALVTAENGNVRVERGFNL